jgi:putative ABC transport system permease protein
VSYPLFTLLRERVTSLSGLFAQATTDLAVSIDGEDEFVTADLVSGAYFDMLGVQPAAGRLLTPGDDEWSASAPASAAAPALVAVITDRFWLRRFGRSPSAIGKPITIGDRGGERVFTIVGVTPPSFQGAAQGRAPDLMLPLTAMMRGPQQRAADFNWLSLLGRLKPGATLDQLNAEVQVLSSAFQQTQAARAPEKERAAYLRSRAAASFAPDGFNSTRDAIARPLLILMGIVGLILVLACVNLSGLLLARAAAREREISIRLAIGASRGRLVRQFLTESLLLASLGGVAGLAIAWWLSAWLFTLFVGNNAGGGGTGPAFSIAPDWRVIAFTCAVSLIACCLAGLTPALQAIRTSANITSAPGDLSPRTRGRGQRALGKALVIAQLAMSMVLLVGATLFLGTLARLYAVDRGFDSDGLLILGTRASHPYPQPRARTVQAALLDKLRATPGVQSASAVLLLPLTGGMIDRGVQVEGYTFRPDEPEQVGFNVIAPNYFATLRTPLLAGRDLRDSDNDTDAGAAPRVAIVNESFARHFFGSGGDITAALGRHVTSAGTRYEIVGVVRDAKYQSLRNEVMKTMYISWLQQDRAQPTNFSYIARVAGGDPLALRPALDRLVRDADPALRVRSAATYDSLIDRSISTERMMASLAGLFGCLALIVAALGVFGVLAFQVARRTNELGVRVALGASRRTIVGLVLRDVIVMVVVSVSIGAGGAFVLTGLARNILFGLTPNDPRVFVISAAVLTTAALLAAWLPARRAARVDPLIALRHE